MPACHRNGDPNIRELMSAHWREAEDAADDDGKFAVAFKATFDHGASPTKLKRAYDAAAKQDGQRILVDRVWPRGITKEDAALDLWLKDVAPSTPLRKWFGHDPKKWPEFQRRYRAELDTNPLAMEPLRDAVRQGRVTLVHGARDEERNNAVVLRACLEAS